jgi:hypothetical protein
MAGGPARSCPVRLALPVRHLPAIALAQARQAGRLRLRRMPGGLGRRAGLAMAGGLGDFP